MKLRRELLAIMQKKESMELLWLRLGWVKKRKIKIWFRDGKSSRQRRLRSKKRLSTTTWVKKRKCDGSYETQARWQTLLSRQKLRTWRIKEWNQSWEILGWQKSCYSGLLRMRMLLRKWTKKPKQILAIIAETESVTTTDIRKTKYLEWFLTDDG